METLASLTLANEIPEKRLEYTSDHLKCIFEIIEHNKNSIVNIKIPFEFGMGKESWSLLMVSLAAIKTIELTYNKE